MAYQPDRSFVFTHSELNIISEPSVASSRVGMFHTGCCRPHQAGFYVSRCYTLELVRELCPIRQSYIIRTPSPWNNAPRNPKDTNAGKAYYCGK